MVKLRLKVGPKGQIIIPKPLREAYNIVEGGSVIIEPREDGILIRRVMDIDELISWISKRRKKLKGIVGRLGDLVEIDLEWEFEK